MWTFPDLYILKYRREELYWRIVVFLPFNFAWRILMAIFSCICFSVTIFEEVFMTNSYRENDVIDTWKNILKFIKLCYLIDFLLSVCHRTWIRVQKSMPYQPKPVFQLVIDFIAVLPVQWITKSEYLIDQDGSIGWYRIANFNGCLSVYRVFVELIYLQQKMWLNPVLICMIQQNALTLSIVSVLCSIWYSIGLIKQGNPHSWLDDMVNADIDQISREKPTDMYVFSFVHVFALLCNETVADIRSFNYYETWFIILSLFAGAVLKYTYLIGNMMQGYLKYQGHMYKIKDDIAINKKCLITKNAEKNIAQYYTIFWNTWMGLHSCPVLDSFPLCLQKDVLTDVYWNAIEHSHVLRHFPVSIKRSISMVMQSQFMQPGDYIFRKGQVRTDYYYIASGVVQIMSHYDGISPIMTISSGSCLGGLSLALPTVCPTDVICATVCEVRTLTFRNFYAVLSQQPNGTKIMNNVQNEHLSHARRMCALSKAYTNQDPLLKLYGVPQDDNLKWIKGRWRAIQSLHLMYITSPDLKIHKLIKHYLPEIDPRHTSKYLDNIVLSSEIKWNEDRCCTRTSCPYTIKPNCNFSNIWFTFTVVILTIDCILVPYCAAFLTHVPQIIVRWDHIVFFTYMLDIYFQLITAVKFVDKTISDPLPLLRYRFTDIMFLVDVVASIPTREITRIFVLETDISPYIALNRLLKIARVFTYFKLKYSNIMASNIITHVIKYTYIFGFISYFAACFFFMVACSFENDKVKCTTKSWYNLLISDMNNNFPDQYGILNNITLSLYRVMKYVTCCGLNFSPLQRFDDIIYCAVLIFISRNVTNFVYTELMAMYLMRRQRFLIYADLKRSLYQVLTLKHIPPALITMVDNYISLQWNVNYAVDLNISSDNSNILSPILQAQRLKLISDNIEMIPFFRLLDATKLKRIVNASKIYIVPKNFIFCRSGEPPTSFNVIIRGVCNKTSMLKQDLIKNPDGFQIGPGAHFPLMECLQHISSLQTTYSLTVCEVISIDAIILRELLFKTDNHNLESNVSEATDFKDSELDIVISKRIYRNIPERIPSFVHRNSRNLNNTVANKSLMIVPSFIIHPHGRFMFVWETLKTVQITITLLYMPAMYTLICTNEMTKFGIAILLDLFSLFDIVVRMHLGRYNEMGVLVYTPSYYIHHSFLLDFFSSVPMYLFYSDDKSHAIFFITCFIKVLQIYRIHGYLKAMKEKFNISKFKTLFIFLFYHIFLMVYLLAQLTFIIACTSTCSDSGVFSCTCNDSWVTQTIFYDKYHNDPVSLVFYFICFNTYIVLGNGQGGFYARTLQEMKLVLVIVIISCASKFYYIPRAVSYLVEEYQHVTQHRDNHKLYWDFINNEGGNEEIAQKMYDYFEYNYVKTKGIDVQKCVLSFHPSLQYDLTFVMYYKAMRCLHMFVGGGKTFMKLLTNKVVEVNYRNDCTVLITDFVSKNIYFVCEGRIAIYNNEMEVKSLGPGSMFGCFLKTKKKRHTYKYASKNNCTLLNIETEIFLDVLNSYSNDCYRKFLKTTRRAEYVEYNDDRYYEVICGLSCTQDDKEIEKGHAGQFRILHADSAVYKYLMVFLSMIVPYITVFPVLFCIATSKYSNTTFPHILIYILDLISLIRIFLGLNATYTDELTGVKVSDLQVIRYGYITSPTRFLLDLLSILPIELVGYWFTKKWINLLKANRLLKVITMTYYIKYHEEKTYVKPWLRWFEFVSVVTLPLYFLTCLWLYITCEEHCFQIYNMEYVYLTDPYKKLVSSLDTVITLLTFSTTYKLEKPWHIKECIVIVFFNIIGFLMLPILIAKFIQTSTMSNLNKRIYEYNIYCMKMYLQLRDLSASLLERLWKYSLLLYTTNNGSDLLPLIKNAPAMMKGELFLDLYGDHIKYNILFEECPSSLIFQLISMLKRTVYFPGDFIIRKLDIDGCMYFINSGEVDEVEFDEMNVEFINSVYITGQCFGLVQGLYDYKPHLSNFRARTMVEMLTLQKSDWQYLSDYFPQDFEHIYFIASQIEHDIGTEVTEA